MQISRIRLSDKTSRLHPRHVVRKPGQAYEPEVPVKVREWIGPALASPDDFDMQRFESRRPGLRVLANSDSEMQRFESTRPSQPVRFQRLTYEVAREVTASSDGAPGFSIPIAARPRAVIRSANVP
jgi:hypothetical protein